MKRYVTSDGMALTVTEDFYGQWLVVWASHGEHGLLVGPLSPDDCDGDEEALIAAQAVGAVWARYNPGEKVEPFRPFKFNTRRQASEAKAAAERDLHAMRDGIVWPEWAKIAEANGWKPPKGWRPPV